MLDEWDNAENFQGFFDGNEAIAEVMQAAGRAARPSCGSTR